jgi:hypothetical protein
MNKKWIIIYTLLCGSLLTFIIATFAQNVKQEKAGEIVKEEYFIAMGKYIPPPYNVTMEDNVVYINGIKIRSFKLPRPESPIVIPVDQKSLKENYFMRLVWEKYAAWEEEHGEAKARQLLSDWLANHHVVKEFKFDEKGVTIFDQLGDKEYLRLKGLERRIIPSERELTIRATKFQASLKDLFNQGGAFFISAKGTTVAVPAKLAPQWLLQTNDILLKNIPDQEKKNLLIKQYRSKDIAEELLANFEATSEAFVEQLKNEQAELQK